MAFLGVIEPNFCWIKFPAEMRRFSSLPPDSIYLSFKFVGFKRLPGDYFSNRLLSLSKQATALTRASGCRWSGSALLYPCMRQPVIDTLAGPVTVM